MENMHTDFWVERGKEAYQVSSHVGLTIWHVEAIFNGCWPKRKNYSSP